MARPIRPRNGLLFLVGALCVAVLASLAWADPSNSSGAWLGSGRFYLYQQPCSPSGVLIGDAGQQLCFDPNQPPPDRSTGFWLGGAQFWGYHNPCDAGDVAIGNMCVTWAVPSPGVGDGVTDDAPAIQAAMNAAAPGSTVTLGGPGKTYRLGSHLTTVQGVTLDGGGSKLSMSASDAMIVLAHGNWTVKGFLAFVYTGGDPSASGYAALIDALPDTHDGLFNMPPTFNVPSTVANAVLLNNPRIKNITFSGGFVNAPGSAYAYLINQSRFSASDLATLSSFTTGVKFLNVKALADGDALEINCPVYAAGEQGNSGVEGMACNGITVSGGDFSSPNAPHGGVGFCIGIAGAFNWTIDRATIHDCKWHGIHLEDTAHNGIISNTTITHIIGGLAQDGNGYWNAPVSNGDQDGIIFLPSINGAPVHDISVFGNTVDGAPGNCIQSADAGGANSYGTNLTFEGNTVRNCFYYGFWLSNYPGPGTMYVGSNLNGDGRAGNSATGGLGAIKIVGTGVTVTGNVNF